MEVGDEVGPYELLEHVGEGAAGSVFRGRHAILERDFAIKFLHRTGRHHETFRERFLREAKLASQLDHDSLVDVVDARDSDDAGLYIVMEYVESTTLEALVRRRGALSPPRAARAVEHVLRGLHHAHEHGLLHRDVSADNVLVDSEGRARLTDFGLVKHEEAGSKLTAQDSPVGTPYYMSPEQWRNDDLDRRTDVFSVGVLLHYLATASFPFPGDSPTHVLDRLKQAPPDPLETDWPQPLADDEVEHLRSKLQAIVRHALARNRDERYATAETFADDVEEWLDLYEHSADDEGAVPLLSRPSLDEKKSSTPGASNVSQSTPTQVADESRASLEAAGSDRPEHVASSSAPRRSASSAVAVDSSPDTNRSQPMTSNEPMSESPDLQNDYVEIAPNVFWVGKRPEDEIFYANPYVRHFPGDARKSGRPGYDLIVDPGSSKDYGIVHAKVSKVIGDMSNIDAIFVNHQDPDVGSAVGKMLGRYAPDAYVMCTKDTWRLIHYYNIPSEKFVCVDDYEHGAKLPTGDRIVPVPSPFCHFVGAMMLYDPESRVLFSGDLFGGLTDRDAEGLYADESDWQGMRAFHQIYMPNNQALRNAIGNIRDLDPKPEVIAPQHGRVIRGEWVEEYMSRLEELPTGLDVQDEREASEDELRAWTTVLNRVMETARGATDEPPEDLVESDPQLSGRVTFQGGDAEILSFGRSSVERAVRILAQHVPEGVVDALKYEAVFGAGELDLPTPGVDLAEEGGSPQSGDEPEGTQQAQPVLEADT